MAADCGRQRSAQAAQACVICKTRKKKCNKLLPSCGYCTQKKLDCAYASSPWSRAVRSEENSCGARPPVDMVSSRMLLYPKSQVYFEVHDVIRSTGQFVDDISARYFQSFHLHFPIISRTRFYNNLITLGAAASADFSVLLLAICLVTYAPALGYKPSHEASLSVERQSLYLTVRSLFSQIQVSCRPSVPLIQTGLLLAVYEYTHGRPEDAFVTIAGSARMAYAARIHDRDRHQAQISHISGKNEDIDLLLQFEEAANTWWGIVIFERIFFNEVSCIDQPLATVFPGGDARLPIDLQVFDQLDVSDPESIPNIPVSCLTSPKLGGYSRAAQATCLLDQVFKCFDTPDIDSRLLQLDRLDTNIQAFLSLVMPDTVGHLGVFCASISISIRALFILHRHILNQRPRAVRASFISLDEWHSRSQKALDTVTKMVVDIAQATINGFAGHTAASVIDAMPAIFPYITRSALRHAHNRMQMEEDTSWFWSAKDVLQTALQKYFERWNVSPY